MIYLFLNVSLQQLSLHFGQDDLNICLRRISTKNLVKLKAAIEQVQMERFIFHKHLHYHHLI